MKALAATLLALFTLTAQAQSAATAGKYKSLQITGAGTFGSTVTATGFTSSNTTSTTLTTATANTGGADTGLIINNSATLTADTSLTDFLAKMQNNGTDIYSFYPNARLKMQSAAANASPGFQVWAGTSGGRMLFRLTGGSGEFANLESDTATITAINLGNCPATNCTVGLGPNAGATPDINIYKGTTPGVQVNVPLRPAAAALATCASGTEGNISRDTAGGGTSGHRTKVCLCTSDGGGTPAYAWTNLGSGTVGTTTTCAD